ncbi:MAG TPA: DUF3109 family protein [Bacteroidales bacterium]|nr:DUF3109 family protein [Bacteroidales bacterium]
MLQIDNTILSLDIIEKKFLCDLDKCKGACCVLGDSGAPLKKDEAELLQVIFPSLKPYLRREGIEAIEKQGAYVIDSDGDMVTSLVNNKECAYAIFEKGIAKCGIEKAFLDNRIDFQKPVSCHLYPIRVTKYSSFEALNYHQWEICKPARKLGAKKELPVYSFLKQPLVREYGEDWYKQLELAAKTIVNNAD